MESLTDLDATLPPKVDTPQFGVVVNGGDIRLGRFYRFADDFVGLESFLAMSLEVSNGCSHLPVSPVTFTARTAAVHHRVGRRTSRTRRGCCTDTARLHGGSAVGRWTCDLQVVGSIPGRWLSRN